MRNLPSTPPHHDDEPAPRVAVKVALPPARSWFEHLAWLPLVALAITLIIQLLGLHPIGNALAASGTGTIDISGSMAKVVELAPTCPGASVTIPNLTPGDPGRETPSPGCVMTFGSNNSTAGADLVVSDAGGAGPAMKCVTSSTCGSTTLADYEDTSGSATFPTGSNFGMRLESRSGVASSGWTVNGSSIASPGAWYDAQDAPDTACSTAAIGDGICSFRFGASASGSTPPGTYEANLLFEVYAR